MVASVLTRTEVLAGMRPSEASSTQALLAVIEWVPVDVAIADRAGGLASQHLRSDPGIDLVDHVIAATTEMVDGRLCTRNVKHFPMITDLAAPY